MRINGLNVDTRKIAEGLYAIIEEKGEAGIVAFGMIPKWIVDLLEKLVREKIISESARQVGVSAGQLTPHVDQDKVKKMVSEISHAVCTDIYAVASERGKMLV